MENVSVTANGSPSTLNNTTTLLSGAATYTGTAELNGQSDVMVSCYSDVAGTLYFDFSVNGTDWRVFPSAGFVVSAGVHEFHTAVKGPRYFRARFVNGATGQASSNCTHTMVNSDSHQRRSTKRRGGIQMRSSCAQPTPRMRLSLACGQG